MARPTFLVIGAMKAGTTSLHRYLRAHPDVFMPDVKEPEFFVAERSWGRGLCWYEGLFAGAGAATALGEASTAYAKHPMFKGVPGRIASILPDVRLVYVVRHPVERVVSHYRQAVGEWGRTGTFEDVVFGNPAEFVAPSRYAMQIERYLEHFARDQLLVVTAEDLRDRRVDTLRQVFSFLGVDAEKVPAGIDHRYNRGADFRTSAVPVERLRHHGPYQAIRAAIPKPVRHLAWRMTSRPSSAATIEVDVADEVRGDLLDRLRPDLLRLPEHLGHDFHCWGLLDGPAPTAPAPTA